MQITDNGGVRKNHARMIPVLGGRMLVFLLAAQFAQPSLAGEKDFSLFQLEPQVVSLASLIQICL